MNNPSAKYLKTLFRALFSSKAADELYEHSRLSSDQERGVRNRFTFHVTLILALCIFTFLSVLTFNHGDPFSYLENRSHSMILPETQTSIQLTEPILNACNTPEACIGLFKTKQYSDLTHNFEEEGGYDIPTLARQNWVGTAQLAANITVNFDQNVDRLSNNDIVLHLPRFKFRNAHVFLNEVKERSFINGEPITLPLKSYLTKEKELPLTVLFDINPQDAIGFLTDSEPMFLASTEDSTSYLRFMETRRNNPNAQVSTTARIVLGLFALILFMIVESSPESLGLALFMGFEAIGLSMSHADLRALWLPDHWNSKFIDNYCHAMGDIMRLYFYVQLARIARPQVGRWLFWGSMYSIPYAYLRYIEFTYFIGDTSWQSWMISGRDVLVASAGMIICSRQAWHLKTRGLPWRVSALTLAAVAASAQFFSAAPLFIPALTMIGDLFGAYSSFVFFVNANAAYFFALSTFLNISTLENRVRVLTREKIRAEAIERELELGRSVQQAFLELPKMPQDIGLSCHYEAAAYVSGDTYFVHWNKELNVLTFLLNDVTGHGVQAALKAFACNIIARSVWSKPSVKGDRRANKRSRLQKYDEDVEELICKDGAVPDFNAMVGAEFHQETGLVRLYRVNYNFPILVEPNFDINSTSTSLPTHERWLVKQIAVPNREMMDLQMKQGAFLLLVSDGFLETARDNRQFIGYMTRSIAKLDQQATSHDVRHLALCWEGSADRKADDRTLLVFQWHPRAQSRSVPKNDAA